MIIWWIIWYLKRNVACKISIWFEIMFTLSYFRIQENSRICEFHQKSLSKLNAHFDQVKVHVNKVELVKPGGHTDRKNSFPYRSDLYTLLCDETKTWQWPKYRHKLWWFTQSLDGIDHDVDHKLFKNLVIGL